MSAGRVGIVVATRDRRDALIATLARLVELPEQPPVVVVDNGSADDSADAVRAVSPGVSVVALERNAGSAARNVGVRTIGTGYVAFSDDDSWWEPGALARAADALDAHPGVAVLAGRILVGAEERLDPACAAMAESPLPRAHGVPFPTVLGFVACGAVVRRSAYLDAGGFSGAAGIGGEEELLALDLAARGWSLVYVDGVVAHHMPADERDRNTRRRVELRNAVRTAWLRRPARHALAVTWHALRNARRDPAARGALVEVARDAVTIARTRSVLPPAVERQLALLAQR